MGIFRYNKNKGFTLIEIVVVVVILVILATITVPTMTKYFSDKTRKERVKEACESLFASSNVVFAGLYADNAHTDKTEKNTIPIDANGTTKESQYYVCAIPGSVSNDVSKTNCYECDMHLSTYSEKIFDFAALSRNNDDPCTLAICLGRYDLYADPDSYVYDPEKAYTVYAVIYQPFMDNKVYFYYNEEINDKWIFEGPATSPSRDNIKITENGEEIKLQLYYLKCGKDNTENASKMWNDQIAKHSNGK